MWQYNYWVRSGKRPYRYHHHRPVHITIGVLTWFIAAIFVIITVKLLRTSVSPPVERMINSNSFDAQNNLTYLNDRAFDYDKGQENTWGYYLPKEGLFFCPVAKVACTEWKRTMRWIGGLQNWETIEHEPDRQGSIPILSFEDMDVNKWLLHQVHMDEKIKIQMDRLSLAQGYMYNNVVSDPGIVKMMAVRNPMARLVSGFNHKCIGVKEYKTCPYLEAFPSIWNGSIPSRRTAETDAQYDDALRGNGCYDLDIEGACEDILAEFVTYLDLQMDQKGRCRIDVHFRPQSCFCDVWRLREQFTLLPYNRMAEVAMNSLPKSRMLTPDDQYRIELFISYRISTPHDDEEKITNSSRYVIQFFGDNDELKEKVLRMYAYDFELMKDIIQWT